MIDPASLYPFSTKDLESIDTADFLTIWEGAVRSRKTIVSLYGWLEYVILAPGRVFYMAGNTLGSLMRNCIDSDYGLIDLSAGLARKSRDADGSQVLAIGPKTIYLFGADDSRAYRKIRGLSPIGGYHDEANLQHRDFIHECFNRTIASPMRRHYMTINPEVPGHWFYKDIADPYEEQHKAGKMPGFHLWHYTLDDNPAITEERKAELKAQYTGVFYQRYILGLRVRAEGGCFPGFDRDRNILDTEPAGIRFAVVGVDIGKSRSATTACALGFFWDDARKRLCLVVLDELYYKENASTGAVVGKIAEFIRSVRDRWTCADVYVDSEEQLIIKDLRSLGLANIHGAIKKEINDRIRFWDLMFTRDRAYIMRRCKHNIEATESAVWNSKVSEREERLDDGSTDIDTLDAREYAAETHMSELVA